MNANILFIDDEKNILKSVNRLLLREPFNLFTTTSPKEGLELLQKESFSLVITDHKMPEMTGIELLEKAKTITPHTIRILITGYTDTNIAIEAVNRGAISWFFPKPWENNELLSTIRFSVMRHQIDKKIQELPDLMSKINSAATKEELFTTAGRIFAGFTYPQFSSFAWLLKEASGWRSVGKEAEPKIDAIVNELQNSRSLYFDKNNQTLSAFFPGPKPALLSLFLDNRNETIDTYLDDGGELWKVLQGLLLSLCSLLVGVYNSL